MPRPRCDDALVSIRRITATILQLALLLLPLSGIRAQDAHCDGADHAPVTAMDLQCHSLPACASPAMQLVDDVRFEPGAVVTVPADLAVEAPRSITQTPEPPPPRA